MSEVVKFVCKEKRFIVGKEEWTFATNSKAFLLNFQEGVYTGSRTVNTTNILNYEAHLDRLVYGVTQHILPSNSGSSAPNLIQKLPREYVSKLTKTIFQMFRFSVAYYLYSMFHPNDQITPEAIVEKAENEENTKEFNLMLQNANLQSPPEMKIILVMPLLPKLDLNNDEEEINNLIDSFEVWSYVEYLPPPKQFVSIEIRHHSPRQNAEFKSITWVKERLELEAILQSRSHLQINESILMDHNQLLYEGLSSNFFVVDNEDRVVVSPEGSVLTGTIMKIILELCEKLNIPVIRTTPHYSLLSSCHSVFISSTSRLLLPVDKVYYPEHEGGEIIIDVNRDNRVIDALRKELFHHLVDHSTKVL